MCGIAGLFALDEPKPVSEPRLRAMTDILAHRGPDGSGIWTAPGVGLGHRRLAIIDLATGAQPMAGAQGRLHIAFNGEIYNYRALRDELVAAGHVFHSDSDTEVILAAYRQWGPASVERFIGMFAFAIHDAADKSLFLARDRLGVKPLHLAVMPDRMLAFASELKGLMAHPGLRRQVSTTAIDDYFAFGYVPDDACFLSGVSKLPAGHWLRIECGKPMPAPTRYWDVAFEPSRHGTPARLAEEYLALMRDAVRQRLVADVPLGAFLSGGVDSSAVVALMAEESRAPVKTCSIGFDVPELDESAHAEAVARRFATEHHSRIVASDDFSLVERLVEAFDEPFADASALPTYRVSELARETVTVALSGDGADEAFAGYRRYQMHMGEEAARRLLPLSVRGPLFGTLGRLYPKLDWAPRFLRAKTSFQAMALTGEEAYARSVGVLRAEQRDALFSPALRQSLGGYRAERRYVETMRAAPASDALGRAQYADLKIALPGDILTKVDRASMAVSLEAREPLLDHRLIEFAASLPPSFRLRNGEGKWLMKKALSNHLPHDLIARRKMGFVTPLTAWFRGPLAGEAERLAHGSAIARTGWFDQRFVERAVRDHRTGIADHGRMLWQLLMLDKSLKRLGLAG